MKAGFFITYRVDPSGWQRNVPGYRLETRTHQRCLNSAHSFEIASFITCLVLSGLLSVYIVESFALHNGEGVLGIS